MKLYIVVILFVIASYDAMAQTKTKKSYPLNWHEMSFDKDSVYGAEIIKAREYLKDKKPKRKVIVAIIDSGCDMNHEDLKGTIWVNKGEIAGNGVDDDKNGYIDDCNGWNFLGNSNGQMINDLSSEADREFMRLHKKFENVDMLKLSKADFAEYQFYAHKLPFISSLGNSYKAIAFSKTIVHYADLFDAEMKAMFPGETLDMEHFKTLINREEKNMDRVNSHFYLAMGWSQNKTAPWSTIYGIRDKIIQSSVEQYERKLAAFKDERALCGDDFNDMNDLKYGNNSFAANKIDHATHIAGIIGAIKDNNIGIDGIADVEMMMLRVNGSSGDEYDKDVALAIRYAVENGANIINMSFGKTLSPNKIWVDEAMMLAEKKGVLLIHAAGNSSQDMDVNIVYPTKHLTNGNVLTNYINVGGISADGNPATTTNYGNREVDLFAPGVEIYSTVGGNDYKKMNGTSFAAPIVTGVAAMIWNYFPELSAQQVKEAILKGVTKREGVVVPKPQDPQLLSAKGITYFHEICVSGGILNAYHAIKIAETMKK